MGHDVLRNGHRTSPTGRFSGPDRGRPLIRGLPATVRLRYVTLAADLVVVSALAAVWLTAGLLADALPEVRTARALHRRTRILLLTVALGTGLLAAVPVVAVLTPGGSAAPLAAALPAVPALVVLATTLRRLTWLRRGAAAFAAAPDTPASPALRAGAAHPLVAVPLQATGLAALTGIPIAAGVVTPAGPSLAGMAITFVGLAVAAIGVRHALRHSRLAEGAVRVRSLTRSV